MFPHSWPRLLTTCCVFTLCVVRKRSVIWTTDQSRGFLTPEWVVQVQRWSSPKTSSWNFLQPQGERGFCGKTGTYVWTRVDVMKDWKVREVCECDGWVCETIDVSSIFRVRKSVFYYCNPYNEWDSEIWHSNILIIFVDLEVHRIIKRGTLEKFLFWEVWRKREGLRGIRPTTVDKWLKRV